MNDINFIPSFGNRPVSLIGRNNIISEFKHALSMPAGFPTRTQLLIGTRGIGKTAMLLELADIAKSRKYVAARVTSSEHMLENIINELQKNGEKHLSKHGGKVKTVSAGALGFSVGLTFSEETQNNFGFQTKLELLVKEFKKHKLGVAIFIDEIQPKSDAIREFATTYQHLIGDEANIVTCMAGLPESMSSVLNDSILTFLNRAHKVQLLPLELDQVSIFYYNALLSSGIKISPKLLKQLTTASKGYPYFIQLLGYYVNEYAKTTKEVTSDIIELALSESKQKLVENVSLTSIKSLSIKDKEFLTAMSEDEEISSIADIAQRLGAKVTQISQYRERLIEKGLIYTPERGRLAFSIPYMNEYFREER